MASRIRNLPLDRVNLLNKASVFSASDLAAADASSLLRRLADWSVGTAIEPPDLAQVEQWIDAARRFGACAVS